MIFSATCQAVAFISLFLLWTVIPNSVAQCTTAVALIASFLCVSYILGNIIDTLPRFRVSPQKKAILITGCDSGFGHHLALHLDRIGYKVFAGCLQANGESAQRLKDSSSSRLTILDLDVTDDKSISQALQTVQDKLEDCGLWAVVNNAGIIFYGDLEWTPVEDYKKQFEVNTFGPVRVTQKFLPLLRKSKGRVIVTASAAGRYTFPMFVPYCMSKHAVVSFCEGLRLEMDKFSVKVISVEPFAYQTAMACAAKMLQDASDLWSKAPETVQADYGSEYIDVFKESLMRWRNLACNPNVHEVVDTLVEAVTSTSPHYQYTIGNLKSVCSFWFIRKLPVWLADYIVRNYVSFQNCISQFLLKKGPNTKAKDF